jgi:DNA processing protein
MSSPEQLRWWLRLYAVPGVGPVRFRELLASCGSPEAVFDAPIQRLRQIPGIDEKTAEAIRSFDDRGGFADRQLECAAALGARIITCADDAYPQVLRQLDGPPPLLFVRGDLAAAGDRAVAIVGSRHATAYGKGTAETLARQLCSCGVTVVSGMARGIDSAAHWGAIRAGGRTVAVLGCGVDVVYPPENRELRDAIIEHGAVISEYPFGEEPLGAHFPTRNRIITGLSLGVVAVEAREDSGVFSSVRWALEQGRDVFAVPGPISSPASWGTNTLIKQGARLVQSVADIIDELHLGPHQEQPPPLHAPQLNGDEDPVFQVLSESPAHIDAIARSASLSTAEALRILLGLEMRDLVKQLPGKMFVRM